MILKRKYGETYIQMKVSEEATWMEATDAFVNFLQGCGYIVQGIDIGEYLAEQYAFQRPQPEPMPEVWVDLPKSISKRKKGKRRAKQK